MQLHIMTFEQMRSAVESLLFVSGEPISVAKMEKILGAPRKDIDSALKELLEHYRGRGIVLLQKGDEWQFATAPENGMVIERMVKSEFSEELSRASLETIAIIAYRGPMTRAKIEYIRGVNSVFTLRNLLLRGLIERAENPDDARSFLYSVSFDFMKTLGIASLGDLPRYEELAKKAEELTESFAHAEEKDGEKGAPEKIQEGNESTL